MLAVVTTAVPIPIWALFVFLMGSQMGLYGLFVRSLLVTKREKKKNGNGNKTITTSETLPHDHEYVTVPMCDQAQQTIRAEMQVIVVEVSHVKEIVARFEQSHKNEHDNMVNHFDQNMNQLKELIIRNN